MSFFKNILALLIILHGCAFFIPLYGYPPAPSHTFFGMVRDEMGNPLTKGDIILETASGVKITGVIIAGFESGKNYQLAVPMDAGITEDLYKPTALRPTVPFKIKVKVGQVVYLPIEMKADYSKLGQPGQRTQLDLTLGEDANMNGLPDAWERALMAQLGGSIEFKNIRPDEHINGNALSVLDQYIAGTYAVNNQDGYMLKIQKGNKGLPQLEFMAIRGRSYTVYGSTDTLNWTPVSFQLVNSPVNTTINSYYANDTRVVQIVVITPDDHSNHRIFKLLIQ